MKKHSLKARITLWFSFAVILISGVAVFATLMISRSVVQKGVRDNLSETVEQNRDEVEYYDEYDSLEFDDPYDMYLEYGDGFLEIDDDFVRNVNGIVTSLYDKDGLIYGDSTLFSSGENLPFQDKSVRTVKTSSGRYFVYDRKLTMDGCEELWLRGTVPSEFSISQVNFIVKMILLLIPVLILFAIVGGYLISKKALKPVLDINSAAESISEGNDLSKRIDIGEGSDEIHSIADSFNAMFERLENSFKKEQQLTADISHELRTPISVIYSQCQLSLEGEQSEEEYKEALELIERQSRKMSGLINDMLAFARLERGAEAIKLEPLNLSECVSAVCEDMALIGENNITLKFEVEPGIIINGNFELLTRMTVNLISNAYRYGKAGGNIEVTLRSENDSARLSVEDDGIGISENDIGKIWDRFYRGDASRSSGGTGLGLSFVREIAEIHSAEISVYSELGVGSKFEIIFKKI